MSFEPRDYQDDSVNYAMGHGVDDRVIHCAPTGSGKTIIQAFIAKRELDRGNRTAIFTPRNEIFDQTVRAMSEICGHNQVAVLRAKRPGESYWASRPIHVVMWPTVVARRGRAKNEVDKKFWMPHADRVLVDECHLSVSPKMGEILEHYKGQARIDGFTATPARNSGKGLGSFFTEIKHVTSVRRLLEQGFLAPCEYWGGATPDLSGIKMRAGDYQTKPLSAACVTLVGDVIDNWLRLASDRHTIVFAVDIAHCEALADRFQKAGVRAEALHDRLPQDRRDRVVAGFKAGDIQVLCNVTIASYGFDAPSVNCIVIARPTKSIVLHLQMIGRGMRPKDDGGECMVLDHAGNVTAIGQADDLYRWRLDEKSKAVKNWSRMEQSGEKEETKEHECEQCHYLFQRSRVCPKCGWEVPFSKQDVDTVEADLVRIGKKLVEPLPKGWPSHEMFYRMLLYHAREKGFKTGWARHQFKKKAKEWPPFDWDNLAPVPPDPRVASWIYSRFLAWTKMQQKIKAQGGG